VTGPTSPDGREWRRYPHIIAICWRSAVAAEMEYRLNFLAGAVLSLFWMAWAAVGVSVFFQFTGDVAGWTYPELLVVIGLFFAINGVRQAALDPNLDRITDYVRRGTLDFLLTKPVDAQLLVSLRHLHVGNLLDPVLGLGIVVGGLVASDHQLSTGDLASFLLLLACSVAMLYAFMLTMMALAVRLLGGDELGMLSFGTVELARFPVELYRNPLQTVLTVIPVALFTTLPAQALLGRLAPPMLAFGPMASAVGLAGSTLAWRRALRGYTGASS
jgi:ABC-2 type transport system permease protein